MRLLRHATLWGTWLLSAGCYASLRSGRDGGQDGSEPHEDGVAERSSDSWPDGGFEDTADGVVDGTDESTAGDFDRDAWYPDHVPDGVGPDQVVLPLPLGFPDCDVPASTGRPCVGGFRCCAQFHDPDPTDPRGTICVDPNVSRGACGGCGRLCPYPARCTEGVCVAPEGYTLCGCAWSDLQRDAFHCGRCGNACPVGSDCIGGRCTAREDASACSPGVSGTAMEMLCGDGCVGVHQSANCESCERRCRSFRPGESRWHYCDGFMFCGQCQDSTLSIQPFPWVADDVGRVVEDRLPGDCPVGMIQWLGGQCLAECPAGTSLEAYSLGLPDDVVTGQGCRPFMWSDSGRTWSSSNTDHPWPYCGAPGWECRGSGSTCVDGECHCMDGLTRCEDVDGYSCADLDVERANCGACGHACSSGEICTAGTCHTAS